MKSRITIYGLLVLPLLLACGASDDREELGAPPVVITSVEVRDLEERIDATGELVAKEDAQIASEVSGRITEILVDEGDAVEAAQVLLEIDPERRNLELADARAGLTEAGAALGEQERDYQRARTLHERGIASDADLDQSETALALARSRAESARARVGVAERAVRDASVRAPFAGLVARREVSRGEFVNAGQPLFELVALDPVEVEFYLAERDSSRVTVGQEVRVSVAPFPGETFRGDHRYAHQNPAREGADRQFRRPPASRSLRQGRPRHCRSRGGAAGAGGSGPVALRRLGGLSPRGGEPGGASDRRDRRPPRHPGRDRPRTRTR